MSRPVEFVNRQDLPSEYLQIMEAEQHHDHQIVKTAGGILKWEADPFVQRLCDNCSLNDILAGFERKGNGKNNEVYRELYRRMGYTLRAYLEFFLLAAAPCRSRNLSNK